MKTVAIVSGGMDSITMLYEFADTITHVLNFVYGSKHNDKETKFAQYHAESLGKEFVRVNLNFVNELFKSDLLKSGGAVPDGHYEDELMRRTVVPFRNGIMLSIAGGYAESVGCDSVMIANHFGDHAIYPDCREAFIVSMNKALKNGTYGLGGIIAPYCGISKRDIALRGKALNVPFHDTWSCYKGGAMHCGRCGTCVERKEALEGFDLTEYEDQDYRPSKTA